MDANVFDRIEKKYLISESQKKHIISIIKLHMKKSKYYKSEVFNLYFDTDQFDLISQSIDWGDFKHKLRARSYSGYDRVFLEIKTKVRGSDVNPGYKRRAMITHSEFKNLSNKKQTLLEIMHGRDSSSRDLQIAREVDYLISEFNLRPKVLVLYHRESFSGEDCLRITFDERLRYRADNLCFVKKKHDKMYFKGGQNIIMEIKSQTPFPLWLSRVLSENKIFPQRFSKIGKVYEKLIKETNV